MAHVVFNVLIVQVPFSAFGIKPARKFLYNVAHGQVRVAPQNMLELGCISSGRFALASGHWGRRRALRRRALVYPEALAFPAFRLVPRYPSLLIKFSLSKSHEFLNFQTILKIQE